MWSFASNVFGGSMAPKNDLSQPREGIPDCSDDEVSSCVSRDEGLECPICWESFNIVENVPYVLWCGHTLCKNCVLGLQWAVVKFPNLPVQLPFFISCPWCHSLSFRLVYKGNLKFPHKNFFLLWMVESMNGNRERSYSSFCAEHETVWPSNGLLATRNDGHHHRNLRRVTQNLRPDNSQPIPNHRSAFNAERFHSSLRKSLTFFVQLTAKFPLVLIFLLIILYVIPASAVILVLYVVITVLFALPSFLILYFAYPTLDWLVREIMN